MVKFFLVSLFFATETKSVKKYQSCAIIYTNSHTSRILCPTVMKQTPLEWANKMILRFLFLLLDPFFTKNVKRYCN